ncbi:TetR/AcrR family transcriptional regulator [Nonomuraea jiangxiensis]|uniref:Regulatory protein, tetR family n=1 Tax=Nonomuraea jiangxiensis TaxID=633440 RepID=A0A1G8WI00_9ACTN|nr:TetR/AcrR family transcriptional regulator [Nonomuraea jiangxiensis]SDJ77959.1 regulatory protein, tetR family [Nonomuraea jiangxiensis]
MAAQKDEPSLWERLERPAPAPRQTLSPERIATAAVGVADAEGIEAITMRRLATELGVAPMAAYRYVSGKDDLLQLMVDHVYTELEPPEEGTGWREALRLIALRTRELMLRHLWLAQLPPSAVLALTPNRTATTERCLRALDGLGLDPDTMMTMVTTLHSYTLGATGAEIAMRQVMVGHGWTSEQEVYKSMARQLRHLLDTGRYPVFKRYIYEGRCKNDPDWQFETGLQYVLDGIAARVAVP